MTIDWTALTARAGRVSHDLIGWIFWDPAAVDAFTALGVEAGGPVYYLSSRAAPLAPAGPDAVAAAFYSISPVGIEMALALTEASTDWSAVTEARDEAVGPGLARLDPALPAALGALAEPLWAGADRLPGSGRVFFATHLRHRREDDPALSAWLAVNCLREWRGDTHWALCVAADLDMAEVGILHNHYMGYEPDWIPASRGATPEQLDEGWARLEAKGLAVDRVVTEAGSELREEIERRTDELASQMWRAVGEETTVALCDLVEPLHDTVLTVIDETAGPNWMPASRERRGPTG